MKKQTMKFILASDVVNKLRRNKEFYEKLESMKFGNGEIEQFVKGLKKEDIDCIGENNEFFETIGSIFGNGLIKQLPENGNVVLTLTAEEKKDGDKESK